MNFDPELDQVFTFEKKSYNYVEHPRAPGLVHSQEGKRAMVYKLSENGDYYALKVFKSGFQSPDIAQNANNLVNLITLNPDLHGLKVADRQVIDPAKNKKLTDQFPDLKYAVIMPWVNGKLWFEIVSKGLSVSRLQSISLATSLSSALGLLETKGFAHCDVSSSNFILSSDFNTVELIDIEEMFAPGFKPPVYKPSGTDGYAPSWISGDKLWGPFADRFATAILLSEILTWQYDDIRKNKFGESYFSPKEIGTRCYRFDLMSKYLGDMNSNLAKMFVTAWFADGLEKCPKITEWEDGVSLLSQNPNVVNSSSYSSAIGGFTSLDDEETVDNELSEEQVPVFVDKMSVKSTNPPEDNTYQFESLIGDKGSVTNQNVQSPQKLPSTPIITAPGTKPSPTSTPKNISLKSKKYGGLTRSQFIALIISLPILAIVLSLLFLPILLHTWLWATVAITSLLGPIAYTTFRKQWLSLAVISPIVLLGGIANQSQVGWGSLNPLSFVIAGLLGGMAFEVVVWIGNKMDKRQFKPRSLEISLCAIGGLLTTIVINQYLFGLYSWGRTDFIIVNLIVGIIGWLIGLYLYNVVVLIRENSKGGN